MRPVDPTVDLVYFNAGGGGHAAEAPQPDECGRRRR